MYVIKQGSGNGAVTAMSYGGVSLGMDLTNRYAADLAGEVGSCFVGFLGSGIPTGTQTASVTHTGDSTIKYGLVITMTAAGDTEIGVSAKDEGDQANPSAALDSGAVSALRYAGSFFGIPDPTFITLLSGMTQVDTWDVGAWSIRVDRQTAASSGSFTIGWTAASDDVAALYVAVAEVGGIVVPPRPVNLSPTMAVDRANRY